MNNLVEMFKKGFLEENIKLLLSLWEQMKVSDRQVLILFLKDMPEYSIERIIKKLSLLNENIAAELKSMILEEVKEDKEKMNINVLGKNITSIEAAELCTDDASFATNMLTELISKYDDKFIDDFAEEISKANFMLGMAIKSAIFQTKENMRKEGITKEDLRKEMEIKLKEKEDKMPDLSEFSPEEAMDKMKEKLERMIKDPEKLMEFIMSDRFKKGSKDTIGLMSTIISPAFLAILDEYSNIYVEASTSRNKMLVAKAKSLAVYKDALTESGIKNPDTVNNLVIEEGKRMNERFRIL